MRFADANIFLYAFLYPKEKLNEKQSAIKMISKNIVGRMEKDEKVVTSTVQLSEICNILESREPHKFAQEVIESILLNDNIEIAEVGKETYMTSLELAKTYNIGINDCVALAVMNEKNIKEIYSFDSDFDKIEGIKRLER